MKVVKKILNFLKPFKIIFISLLVGFLLAVLGTILSNSFSDKNNFNEIKNLTKSDAQIKENQQLFSSLTSIYDFTKQSIGIDVSVWQGNINWEKVAKSGIDFVMIRTGYRENDTDLIMDNRFKENLSEASQYGLKIGLYFYSTARNEIEALEEAKWVCENIGDYKITYPIAYDLENIGEFRTTNISDEQLSKNAKIFMDYISNKGYVPALYSNAYDLNHHWDTDYLKNYLTWYAHYTTSSNYAGNYAMWQYSDKGKINGISGNVDLNVAYFSYIGE